MNRLASPSQLRASLLRWALVCVPGVMLLGFLAGRLSGGADNNPWFDALAKPDLYPPPIVFPVVWGILYAVMGFALAIVCAARGARGRPLAIRLFWVQLALNLAYTPLFFAARQITGAQILLFALSVAVLATAVAFWRVRRSAGLLMLPYLAWVLFATVLNWQFLRLNPDADGASPAAATQRVEL